MPALSMAYLRSITMLHVRPPFSTGLRPSEIARSVRQSSSRTPTRNARMAMANSPLPRFQVQNGKRDSEIMAVRRFPHPWSVEEKSACFVVPDHGGQRGRGTANGRQPAITREAEEDWMALRAAARTPEAWLANKGPRPSRPGPVAIGRKCCPSPQKEQQDRSL
jgi:hypothetical protein